MTSSYKPQNPKTKSKYMNHTISALEDSCSWEISNLNINETTPNKGDRKTKCFSSQKHTAYFMKKAQTGKVSQSTWHNARSLQQEKSENSILNEEVSKQITNSKKKLRHENLSKLSKWEDFLLNKLKLSTNSPDIDSQVPIYSLTVR